MKEETTTQIQNSLNEMYELGVEHGKQLAYREAKIKELEKEVAKLNLTTKDIGAEADEK